MIVYRFGILPSISDSWYVLPLTQNLLFTLFTWGIGIPMLLYGNIWFVLSGVGLSFVGAATMFKMKKGLTSEVHYAGAVMGIFCALIGITFMYQNFLPLVLFLVSAITIQIFPSSNKLWWQEIAAFFAILLGLLTH